MFVEVAFNLPLNRTFHYRTLNGETSEAYLGRRVLAPFGKKTMVGYAVGFQKEAPAFPTKPVQAWVDDRPLLDEGHRELAQWLSKTYLCSVGEALSAILPAQLKEPKRVRPPSPSPSPAGGEEMENRPIELSAEQQNVLAQFLKAVDSRTFHPFLLRGITHSGKTELYLRTIDHVLKQDRQALFLLPEIALTPPFIDRLTDRYAGRVGLWHSGISAGERYRTWERARSGDLQVLLGARSAVFAPFPNLGVIVVDEEHEASYKQEDRPRYHARDVALWRARRAGAAVILGSATPSLESYWNAKKNIYTLVELTSRVEMRQLPPVELIDRRHKKEAPDDGQGQPKKRRARHGPFFSVFSESLKLAIEQRLARKEQVMLFINRRGFTPFLRCSKCGWVARCDRCSLTLAEHLDKGSHALQCHSCLRTFAMIIQCPSCKSMRLGHFGIGTQKVEEEVKHLFPFVKIARLDRDVEQPRKTYEKVYRAFAARELDVLVGTQIIAKGFDFPAVTLVGVVDADVSLHLPDFRSAERTFQLLTQVAGRTGRGEQKGKVLVQTHHPDHYALQAAREHDYLRFYDAEIKFRETLNYPPYCRLVHVLVRARKEDAAQKAAEDLAEQLQKVAAQSEGGSREGEGGSREPGAGRRKDGARLHGDSAVVNKEFLLPPPGSRLPAQFEVLGPAPSPHSRIRGQFRYQIVIKGTDETLTPALDFLRGKRLSKAFLSVDVDPMDLL